MTRRKNKAGRRGLYNKRLTPDEQRARKEQAFAAIRNLYAACLPLWRFCAAPYCRRHKVCGGDVRPCLRRCWPLLPQALQDAAYAQAMRGGPLRVPPATHTEWSLRSYPPSNFVH